METIKALIQITNVYTVIGFLCCVIFRLVVKEKQRLGDLLILFLVWPIFLWLLVLSKVKELLYETYI